MSILIKGMGMPKSCADCPFRETKYDPGYYYYEHCKASGRIFNESKLDIDPFEEKLNDCPLVEITTPHGRLIDRDAVPEVSADPFEEAGFQGVLDDMPVFLEAEGRS